MNYPIQAGHCHSRFHFLVTAVLVLWLSFLPFGTPGHDLFAGYIQHKLKVSIGKEHLDVVLNLTFFEEWSVRERLKMDTDLNGSISNAERNSYVAKLSTNVVNGVKLAVKGRPVKILPLYEPEIDFLDNASTNPGHHRLQLTFFIATPEGLRVGDVISISETLWPEAKALASVEVAGRDGFKLEPQQYPGLRQQHDKQRVCRLRLLEVPRP